MIGSFKLNQTLQKEFFRNIKPPENRKGSTPFPKRNKDDKDIYIKALVSKPVVRYENSKFFLAVFLTYFSYDEIKNNQMKRPDYYGLIDIENGSIVKKYDCRKHDFSSASFDQSYSFAKANKQDASYIEELFQLLDSVRQSITEKNSPDHYIPLYKKYMDKLLHLSDPSDYQQFYEDLSKIEAVKAPIEEWDTETINLSTKQQVSKQDRKRTQQKYRAEKGGVQKDSRSDKEKQQDAIKKIFGDGKAGSAYLDEINGKQSDKQQKQSEMSDKANKQMSKQDRNADAEQDDSNGDPGAKKEAQITEDNVFVGNSIEETTAVDPQKMQALLKEIKDRKQESAKQLGKDEPGSLDHEDANKGSQLNTAEDVHGQSSNKDDGGQTRYTFRDLQWVPKENLSVFPERYYKISERIADRVDFLPCEKPMIRFKYPLFCFENDTVPGVDPWQMMQLKVINKDLVKGHYRIHPQKGVYTSCVHKERCLFNTCPYVLAAYIKYLKETNPDELSRQRNEYFKQKSKNDQEGGRGYLVKSPKQAFAEDEIARAIQFIDLGLFSISRKKAEKYVYVITYVSDGDAGEPAFGLLEDETQKIKSISSFCVTSDQLENGLSEVGYITRTNGKRIPKGVDCLIWADYLMITGKIKSEENSEMEQSDDIVTISYD